MKKYIITEEQLTEYAYTFPKGGNFAKRRKIHNEILSQEYKDCSERTPKKSLLERQTEATEKIANSMSWKNNPDYPNSPCEYGIMGDASAIDIIRQVNDMLFRIQALEEINKK